MGNNRRTIFFFLFSGLILVGWLFLLNWVTPPKPKDTKPEETKPLAAEKAYPLQIALSMLQTSLTGGPYLGPTLETPADLVAKADERKKTLAKLTQEESAAAFTWLAMTPLPQHWFVAPLFRTPEIVAAAKKGRADRLVTLGGSDYKVTAQIADKQAAISQITLNAYRAATFKEALALDEPFVLVSDGGDRLRRSFRFLVDGADLEWQLQPGNTAEEAVFKTEVRGVTVTKTFRLKKDQYHLDMDLHFSTAEGKVEPLVYQITGPQGVPVDGAIWYMRPYREVALAGVEAEDRKTVHYFKGQRLHKAEQQPEGVSVRQLTLSKPTYEDLGALPPMHLQYAGIQVPFFAALAVVAGNPAEHRYIESVSCGYALDLQAGAKDLFAQITMTSTPVKVEKDKPVQQSYLLYAGPSKVRLLRYEADVRDGLALYYEEELHLDSLTDSPDTSWMGGRWSGKIGWTSLLVGATNLMHFLLERLYDVVRHYGVAIIFLTVLVRLAMFPISRKQTLMSRNMQEKMAIMRPELKKVQEKFRNDLKARQQAMMDVYRKYGVNPLAGCMGCLVVLLQMPIFMGLYYALNESVHLRLAGFLWIDNLAAPDMLVRWDNWPLIGPFAMFLNLGPYFNVLPIVAIILMVMQQKLLAPPAMDEQQAMQMKIMNYMMIFFAYMFYWVPAGLCLYFIISSAWGLFERKLLPASKPASGQPAAAKPPPDGEGPTDRSRRAGKPPGRDRRDRDQKPSSGLRRRIRDWWANLLKQAEKK